MLNTCWQRGVSTVSCDYIISMFMSQSDMLYGLGMFCCVNHLPLLKKCFMFLLIFIFILYVSFTVYTVNVCILLIRYALLSVKELHFISNNVTDLK